MNYKIRLDVFEGQLDLLLYLIKKEELDIYDIPITRITEQYLETLNLTPPPVLSTEGGPIPSESLETGGGVMKLLDLVLAGEFLVMAATLMQIKSKMLLPPDPSGEV